MILKNCKFGIYGLTIGAYGNCTLDNCHIDSHNFLSIDANDLTIKNMNIQNYFKTIGESFRFILGAENKLNIINSNIGKQKQKTHVELLANKEINIINSNIEGDIIDCEGKKINSDKNSSLTANERIRIKSNEYSLINVNCPTITLNNNLVSNSNGSLILKNPTNSLINKRIELIKLLNSIKNNCENKIFENITKYKKEQKTKSIFKILERNKMDYKN